MLNRLVIDNFKVHKHLDLPLRNLTVLTGYNSAGKSSVIQALLLLRQNYANQKINIDNIDLNGNLCRLGFCKDVLCYKADSDEVAIFLSDTVGRRGFFRFEMNPGYSSKTYAPSNEIRFEKGFDFSSLFTSSFQYISINRVGPLESYPLDSKVVEQERQLSKDQGKGELTPHFLYYYGKEKPFEVPNELCCPFEEGRDLISQVSAWESLISAGVRVNSKPVEKSFSLEYSYDNGVDSSPSFSAVNVGSGLSFVLPIITALLSTPKEGLVIIENPEAHLHPKGQAELAKLICAAARYGIQVLIETHSDHIINGILLEAKAFENTAGSKGVDKADVAIHYFIKHRESLLSEAIEVKLDNDGRTQNQPEGFFDQIENDMMKLLNIE